MKRRRQDPNHRLVLVCSCVWLLVASHSSSSVGAFTAFRRTPVRAHQASCSSHRRHPSTACLSAATKPSDGGTLCIKFSRCYQRFIAYRPRRGRPGRSEANADAIFESKSNHNNATTNRRLFCRFDDECREVVQSFLYLDEALELYPSARLVKLQEVSDREDDADYNQIVPGMGIRPSSSVSRIILDPNNRDVGLVMEDDEDDIEENTNSNAGSLQTKKENIHHNITRQGLEALEYLTSLTVSLVASQSRDKGDDMDTLRQNIASTLRERIGMKRFMEHSPQSLQQNYHRLMDLFTRGRAWNADGGGIDEIIGPGLALRESEARNVISYFPELCLYDYHEVEERIHFFLSPLPPEDVVGSLSDAPTSKRKRRGRRPSNSTSNAGGKEVDWARLSWEGFGAGFTIQQATQAVRAIPNLLSLRHTDSRTCKPNMLYFMRELEVSADMSIPTERNLEKYLLGTEPSDVWAFAYLHTLGLQWSQLRIILDAYPTLTCIGTEANWELRQNKGTQKALNFFSLAYLRKRLQIGPRDVFIMLKTHPQLSLYKIEHMLPKLEAYQDKLGLTGRDLRKVLLRQPSLLGLSETSFNEKLGFFFDEVGMTVEETRQALLKQPSMLQYSLETLRSKLDFLRNELCMSQGVACRVLHAAPAIFGLSLAENLRPKVATLMIRCRLSVEEVGLIAAAVPSILVLSSKRKIEPCLSYLSVALRLPDEATLGSIIKAAPRTLIQSINSSLEPKLQMLDKALEKERTQGRDASPSRTGDLRVSDMFVKNPALLATTNAILAKRIEASTKSPDSTLAEAMGPSPKGRRPKFTILDDKVVAIAESREGKANKGRTRGHRELMSESMAAAVSSLMSSGPSFSDFMSMSPAGTGLTPLAITAFISGQVFPPDTPEKPRGLDRMGGMAIQIAQKLSARQLKAAAESSTSAVIPETDEPGSNYESGLILLKYPHLRASRHRCELCACEIALKIILLFLRESASSYDLSKFDVRIEICTDSNYVMKMVKDKDLMRRLGDCSGLIEKFDYQGPGPKSHANLDILFPLSQYYVDLTTGRPRPITVAAIANGKGNNENSDDVCIGGSVGISFKHISDVCSGKVAEQTTYQMFKYARQAAMWSYDRDRKLRLGSLS